MLRAAWGWARGCLLPHRILPGGCCSPGSAGDRDPLKHISPAQEDLRSFPKLVFPARLEEPGAGPLPVSPGLFSRSPPPSADANSHSQPKVQKKPTTVQASARSRATRRGWLNPSGS